jgi:predicted molibdopterin-dependent oxidoreductase YjgC
MFINDRSLEFEAYKSKLLAEDFDDLFEKSGVCCIDELAEFAKNFNNEMNGVLVFSEKEVSSNVSLELFNMAIVTGKLGKTAQGIIALKEKNNSQGIIDMGACHKVAPGFQPYDDPRVIQKLKMKWSVDDIPTNINSPYKLLKEHKLKNVFIFGEDPVGCAINKPEVEEWFNKLDFMMVQDYFLTETARKADLILPASLPFEIGGSFTNTQKYLQKFDAEKESAIEEISPQQLIRLMEKLGVNGFANMEEALWEVFTLLPPPADPEKRKYQLHATAHDNYNRMFNHGCDIVNKRFDEEFEAAFVGEK